MLWLYLVLFSFILSLILVRFTDWAEDAIMFLCAFLGIVGLFFSFYISKDVEDRVAIVHDTYEVISLADAGLVPPYSETNYAVYTEEDTVGFYCRTENGLIEFKEIPNVIFCESEDARYEHFEYDHKEGLERHLKANLYANEDILYLPKGATISPIYQAISE